MKRTLTLLLAVVGLSACETTGDPYAGGLFGWSSKKYDQRIQEKDTRLRGIQSDTADQNRQAASYRSQNAQQRAKLRRLE